MRSFYISVLSGLLTGLAFDSPALSFLAWFSLIPSFYVIKNSSRCRNFLNGFLFGFCYYAAGIFWVGNVSKLGLFFLVSYLGLYYALLFVLISFFTGKRSGFVIIPALWVAIEFIKEKVWCGFSWGNLGYSQYTNTYLIQSADLGGVKLITFLIVLVNLSGWVIYSRIKNREVRFAHIFKAVSIPLMVFLASFGYSVYRLDNLDWSETSKVSVIQPNIEQELKWQEAFISRIKSKLLQLSLKAEADSLLIFPEASWPEVLGINETEELKSFARTLKRDMLIGSVIFEKGKFYNSAIMLDREGEIRNVYRKIKLVPFGEYVPLREFLRFINVLNSVGDTTPGEALTLFSHKGSIFSVLICFEDIFPAHVRSFAKKSDFLINITNDAWFKGEPEAGQHLGIMTLRAIENRIAIVRSANTGISGWVSFNGDTETLEREGKEVYVEGCRDFEIKINEQRSFYNKYGEVFSYLCLLCTFLALAGRLKLRDRKR
ncbi:MAG: apolipoprotein N-acyltransferase [Candidatus Omnitrophica bacterium]|nr:apolipoprotein N-acyltransferase [Candidatus Omnitrophota bacterium]MBD3269124.1 apolipoprotein N-acyltransferase [Candidatus Omnitrophota bacterium]